MVETIIGGLILATLLWVLKLSYNRFIQFRQKRVLISWLRANTRDEPGESHKSLLEAAQHLGISIEEINHLVLHTKQIFHSKIEPDLISIWREEPQSIYEKRGLLMI
jgi:hypothetical protein